MNQTAEIPQALINCFNDLDQLLEQNPASGREFKDSTNEYGAAIMQHHFLGRWVRNQYKLWQDSDLKAVFSAIGVVHPDDISHLVLVAYHRFINEKPVDLETQKEASDNFLPRWK